jgi:hypothetical protein
MTRIWVEAPPGRKEKKKKKKKRNIEGVGCLRNFVRAFAEHLQRVAEVSPCVSVRLSESMEQLCSKWKYFREMFEEFYLNLWTKFKFG